MDGLECPVSATRRDRVLSDDELVKIWHAADDGPFGHVLKLLILTGARREEITQLRWAEVAGDTISLPGERTKTGEARIIPLSAPAVALLRALPRNGATSSLPQTARNPSTAGRAPSDGWMPPRNKSAVGGPRHPQDGRNRLPEARRQPADRRGRARAHRRLRAGIVRVYQVHDFAAEKRAAVEQWGAHVMDLIGGQCDG